MEFSKEARYVLNFINGTNSLIFLTGKAGTGKTTLLREIVSRTHKRTVVVAPTGIAALNAGGVTIHSQFQLPFGGFAPTFDVVDAGEFCKIENKTTVMGGFKMNAVKRTVLQGMELLVVDEVSMLRPDLLDAVDFVLQKIRRSSLPFGGVQVLFIGDLLQLPPIVKNDEWQVLRNFYQGKFFFHAQVFQRQKPIYIELEKIYRQKDDVFVEILNNLRNNQLPKQNHETLNRYVKPDFNIRDNTGYIVLTTHNQKADEMNSAALDTLASKEYLYEAEIQDDFPDRIFPLESKLRLKVGAQVMFVKNDSSMEKRFYNGKIGVVKSLSVAEVVVSLPEEGQDVFVERHEWENIRYKSNPLTGEIEEEVLGTFVQYPLRLAWAITVHKSQGLTFEKAVLDVSDVFVPGQLYVALSRLTSLEGLVLKSPLRMNGLSNEQEVMDYAQNKATEKALEEALAQQKKAYSLGYLTRAFQFGEVAKWWDAHLLGYGAASNRSEKTKRTDWAKEVMMRIIELRDTGQKFCRQLSSIFSAEILDLAHLNERVEKGSAFFLEKIDPVLVETMTAKELVKTQKKTKEYFEELYEFEEMLVQAAQSIMRAQAFSKCLMENTEFSKTAFLTEDYNKYRAIKEGLAKEKAKSTKLVDVEDEDIELPGKPKKKTKAEKGITYLETFQLISEGKTIDEVAEQRKLSKGTILNHVAKLVERGEVNVLDFVDKVNFEEWEDKLKGLDFKAASLGEMQALLNEPADWEELRIYKAGKVWEGKMEELG